MISVGAMAADTVAKARSPAGWKIAQMIIAMVHMREACMASRPRAGL